MDERAVGARGERQRRTQRCSLAMGGARYPIVSEDSFSCLIEAPAGARIRGVADIYDGERHRAHCLVVLSRAEGSFLRVIYKRRTEARAGPAADYAAEETPAVAAADAAEDPGHADPGASGWGALAARLAFRRGAATQDADGDGPRSEG